MKTTDKDLTCPFCESAQLQMRVHTTHVQHDGKRLSVNGMEYCECPACGADPVLTDQIRRNESRIADAKRLSMGLLTGAQIRLIRKHLDLTQREASELFGGGANSFSKYERGEVLQSAVMDLLLKMLASCPELIDLVRSMKAIQSKLATEGGWQQTGLVVTPSAQTNQHPLPPISRQHEWQAVA